MARGSPIKGEVAVRGFEGLFKVLALSNTIDQSKTAPHTLSLIVKAGPSSPHLLALVMPPRVKVDAVVTFYRPGLVTGPGLGGKNVEREYLTMTLTQADVQKIKTMVWHKGELVHDLTLMYQRMEWTAADGGATAADTWVQQ